MWHTNFSCSKQYRKRSGNKKLILIQRNCSGESIIRINWDQKSSVNSLNAELNPICHLLILLGDLTFMGPCIVCSNIYPTRCNVTQFIYIWKLLYMFRVVLPPTIRSAYTCIYSICYLSHRYCYLPLSVGTGLSVLWVAYARCCRYRCMRSWWWVEVPPETCRLVSRYK
jgi:hypothetical protein